MKFKDYYNHDCAILLADKILNQISDFDKEAFVLFIDNHLEDKGFMQRQDLFAEGFDKYLPSDLHEVIAIFSSILGPELSKPEGMFTEGWWLWPIGRYIEKFGDKDIDASLGFIYELTKRHTGEFAVRPLLEKDARYTLSRLKAWSKDTNVHVRRLASEGMRIRLPWAKKSYAAVDQFDLFSSILNNLKSDNEKFVQKSVGNNLNDLIKENSDLAYEIINKWKAEKPSKETLWIIRHGMRSLK